MSDPALKTATAFDAEWVRADFPILHQEVNGHPLVYLDNAATTQKPQAVIQAIVDYYQQDNSNVHRGAHALAERATEKFEAARGKVARFINAPEARQIIWTRGTTESINLVAASWGRANLKEGDRVLVSAMEHHSNIVPWQMLRDEKDLTLRVAPIDDQGNFLLDEFEKLLNERTKIVAITHASNALGTIVPLKQVIAMAHDRGAVVLVDGCQAVPHMTVDVVDLDCDFYVFSGHKLYGPSGIGALYGKAALLEAMPPYQGGGEMILTVAFDKTEFNVIPHKFEAGTPHIAGAIALGATIDYLNELGFDHIAAHEKMLLEYATERLTEFNSLHLIGTADNKASILSFTLQGIHPHDIGTVLDRSGIAIRAGHHCAQPVMDRFGIAATARASFGIYNSREDVDALAAAIGKTIEMFG